MTDILQQADEIRDEAARSSRKFEETRKRLQQKAETAWEDTIDWVRRYPVKALGIAVSTGFVLGSLTAAMLKKEVL